jgi:hypothetical protein
MRRLPVFWTIAASVVLTVVLGGCQPTFQAEVTRFYSLPPVPPGKSFAIAPDAAQAADLEFQHYAQMMSAALQGKGFRLATPGSEQADVVVALHYGTIGSRTEVMSEPAPGWGHPGWWGWRGYPPQQISSYTFYSEFLDVALFDGQAWRNGERRSLYQGRVVGDSGVRDLNATMPYLIKALLQDFPGANGQTLRVSVPLEQ